MVGEKSIVLAAGVLLSLLAGAGNVYRFETPGSKAGDVLRIADLDFESCSHEDIDLDEAFERSLGADDFVFRVYSCGDGRPVWLFIGYFSSPGEGSQIHSPKHCYPGSGWNILGERPVPAPWGEGSIRALSVSNGRARRGVFYWFYTGDEVISDEYGLKIHQVVSALRRRAPSVCFVRISTPELDAGETESILAEFARKVQASLEKAFKERR
jgi:EpsI family protein